MYYDNNSLCAVSITEVYILFTLNRFDSFTIVTITNSNALFGLYFQTFINFNRLLPLCFYVISMREFLYYPKVLPFR